MSLSDLEKKLREYGLDEKEAGIYVSLAEMGSSRASEVARVRQLNRVDVYRTLKRLQGMGLVETLIQKPMKFAAVAPEKAFDLLIKSVQDKIVQMERDKELFLKVWSSFKASHLELESERFRVIQGRSQYFATLRSLFMDAKKEILLITTKSGLIRLYHSGLDNVLEERRKDSVKSKVLSEVDRSNMEAAERISSVTSLRHISMPTSSQFTILDDSDVVVNMVLDDSFSMHSERDVSLWTNSVDYIAMMKKHFNDLWNDSVDYSLAVKSLLSGTPIPETRIIREEDMISKKLEIFSKATKRITILTGLEGSRQLSSDPVLQSLKSYKDKGVTLSLMLPVKQDNIESVKKIQQYFTPHNLDFDVTAELTVVDDKEMLLIQSSDSRKPSENVAFWTNDINYTSMINNFLHQLWNNSRDASLEIDVLQRANILREGIESIKTVLNKQGWSALSPGFLQGRSNAQHTFTVVASRLNETLALDCVINDHSIDATTTVTFYAKKIDCQPNYSYLLVSPRLDENASKLITLYGIELIEDESVENLFLKLKSKIV